MVMKKRVVLSAARSTLPLRRAILSLMTGKAIET
jgi:hypothetical protein